jgi:hypothetical protein
MKKFFYQFLIDKWRGQFLVSLPVVNLGSDEAAILGYKQTRF